MRETLRPHLLAAARARRPVFRELMLTDPRRALAEAVPAALRASLPPEIQAEMEQPFDTRGDLEVVIACADPHDRSAGHDHREEITRHIVLDGVRHEAALFGRRLAQDTKRGLPVHGVALDGVAAVAEEPFRLLEAAEKSARGLPASRAAVSVGGDVRLMDFAALPGFENSLVASESGAGPAMAAEVSTAWTTGQKKVLIIRVDFSDRPGAPLVYRGGDSPEELTPASAEAWIADQVSPIFSAMSYGKTTLVGTATTQVYRLPETYSYYNNPDRTDALHTAATQLASADYPLANYDRLVVVFSNLTALPFSGSADVGGARVWQNGSILSVGHELGHTYGLRHANVWYSTDGDPLSAAGQSAEYADPFDIMGGAVNYDPRAHFNAWFKNRLGWLEDAQVRTITTGGTYRVYRFDHAAATGTLALKIARNSTDDYWIALRKNFTDNASLSHGANILWGYHTQRQSNLLDLTTPGYGQTDSALALGRSLADPVAGVTITPVAEGGTAPAEWLDVQVTFGPAAPIYYTEPAAQTVGVGQSAVFQASAGGVPAPTLRWQRQAAGTSTWADLADNATYSGTATNTLVVSTSASAMSGDLFRVVATNASASTPSASAALTVATSGVFTLAGRARSGGRADGVGPLARFARPIDLTLGADGTLYVVEQFGGVRKVRPDGTVTTLASPIGSSPNGIAVDTSGNVFVSDYNQHVIRKVTPAGLVSVFAGSSGASGPADGTGSSARFNQPSSLAFDRTGNLLVSDTGNRTIRRITPAGAVTTIAGQAGVTGNTDATGTAATFALPTALAFDAAGNLFISDSNNFSLRRMTPEGVVTTWLTSVQYGGFAIDATGRIYAADWGFTCVWLVRPDKAKSVLAGGQSLVGSADGPLADARFNHPSAVALAPDGSLYVVDADNYTIRHVVPTGRPQIQTQPQAQTLAAGQTASFSVTATSDTAFTYQWLKDGIAIAGATSATYTIPAVTTADTGSYRVAVSNAAGTATSTAVPLVVGLALLTQPSDIAVNEGSAASYSVLASGSPSPAYQWFKGGSPIAGATSATLTLASTAPSDAGSYTVVTSNSTGSITSSAATLTVYPRPVASVLSANIPVGDYTQFTVVVAGLPATGYQWQKDGVPVPSATSSQLTIYSAALADAGTYRALITNAVGTVASNEVTLTVGTPPGLAADALVNQTVTYGQSVSFTVSPTGTPPFTYQWYRGSSPVTGATAATLSIASATASDAGYYTVRVTSPYGSRNSNSALLTVNPITPVVTWPELAPITYGTPLSSTQFNATADVPGTFSYNYALGTTLSPGTYTLNAGFTPTDLSAYRYVSTARTLTIGKATPTLTWAAPSAITYGTALSSTQLNATASVPGTFTYSPGAGVALNAGAQTLNVTFTPAAFALYNTTTGSVTLTVSKATPALTWAAPSAITYGTALSTTQLNATASVPGTFVYSPAAGSTPSAGTQTLNVTFTPADTANYSPTSASQSLTVLPAGYLSNLSVRAATDAAKTLIVGFVIDGGAKPVLVRAAGPALNNYGLTGVADPALSLHSTTGLVAANDNWSSSLAAAFATLGAFAFDAASKDAALQQSVTGAHTAQATATNAGTILVEAYDAGPHDGRKLTNLSARFTVGTGDNILIAGFVLAGSGTRQLLVRAVGPKLADYGVTGVLADPQFSVYDGNTALFSNNDWSSSLAATFTTLGAFALTPGTGLPTGDTRSAALLVTLQAGKSYTVQVSGVGHTTGEALVELYLVP